MHLKFLFVLSAFTIFAISLAFNLSGNEKISEEVCFERDILPIFLENCALSGCHNSESRKHGFVFDSYDNIISSNRGRNIIPFNLKKSKIYKKITEDTQEDRMPPPPNPALTSSEISLIGRWINEGALNTKCADDKFKTDVVLDPVELTDTSIVANSNCDTLAVTYKDVQPVIEKNCYKCHSGNNGPDELFNLDSYDNLKEKGSSGKLFGAVNHLPGFMKMPRKSPKLTGCDLDLINAWINQGLKDQ